LSQAVERGGIDLLTEALVTELYADEDGTVCGVTLVRPDGSEERLGCGALILACCGFAGNAELVAHHIPEIAAAEFYGHPGTKGDALRWGRALGASLKDLGAYQGHGGLAAGRGVPILWPLIMEGGFQVNRAGRRFSNEARGYSEQAVDVVAQPEHLAWSVYDERLHQLMLEFDDYRDALEAGAVMRAETAAGLAERAGLPPEVLEQTLEAVAACTRGEAEDVFGRDFTGHPVLEPPYYAVKVTGALFHTQGGLEVDGRARVLDRHGRALPNLFAGGGAARGVSGPSCWGYMAGNGLLTATTFGRLAGETAAALVGGRARGAKA
jgi:fumarate reductase flavoprotein subunit